MAESSTVVVASEPKPILHKTFWLAVIAVAVVLIATVLLLPNKPDVFGGYSTRQLAYLLAVFYIAGLESGLSGFGFSGVAAASLALLPPILGTPLLQSLSTANQLVSIGELKKDMPKTLKSLGRAPGPYILGGRRITKKKSKLLSNLPATQLMLIFGSICCSTRCIRYSGQPHFRSTVVAVLSPESSLVSSAGRWAVLPPFPGQP